MILQTTRLSLHTIQQSDIPILYEQIFSDATVMQYAFAGRCFSMPETEAFITNYAAEEGESIGVAAVRLSEDNALVGFAGLMPYGSGVELGFVLSPKYWGMGYATEIGQAQIALASDLGLHEVYALVSPENRASISVLKKLKMHYLKTVKSKDRGARDVYRRELEEIQA